MGDIPLAVIGLVWSMCGLGYLAVVSDLYIARSSKEERTKARLQLAAPIWIIPALWYAFKSIREVWKRAFSREGAT